VEGWSERVSLGRGGGEGRGGRGGRVEEVGVVGGGRE